MISIDLKTLQTGKRVVVAFKWFNFPPKRPQRRKVTPKSSKIHEKNRFSELVCLATGVWSTSKWFEWLLGLVKSSLHSFLIKKQWFSALGNRLRPLCDPWGAIYSPFMCKIPYLVKIHKKNRFSDLVCFSTGAWSTLKWFRGLMRLVESIFHSFLIKKQLF